MTKESKRKVPVEPNDICPECKIKYNDCGCTFVCPACGTRGEYQDDHIICPLEDCRVMRFFTQ